MEDNRKTTIDLLILQLKNSFLLTDSEGAEILGEKSFECAYSRTLRSLRGGASKYFSGDLNPFNTVQYCMFLYFFSNELSDSNLQLADKVYYLNKMLNAVDLYHEIKLPDVWGCEHPLGAVMGKAKYGERFFFYQGCTVGGNRKNGELFYPEIGEDVMMYSNSKILGNSVIGNRVILSANTYIINSIIPDDVIVFGSSPDLVIKERHE